MNKEIPKSYKIKAICKNCGYQNELEIPFGVDTSESDGIYFSRCDEGYEYYNLDTKKFQSTAFYPRCCKCGSVHLQKQLHLENAIEILEKQISDVWDKIGEIKSKLNS